MNIGIVSYLWSRGGAARSARSLAVGLVSAGHQVTVYSSEAVADSGVVDGMRPHVVSKLLSRILLPRLAGRWRSRYPEHAPRVHYNVDPWFGALDRLVTRAGHDVVNIHWFQSGFLSLRAIQRLGRTALITTHDSWLATGGCHAFPCERYRGVCGSCPALGSHGPDITIGEIREKRRRAKDGSFSVVSPSEALAERIGSSMQLGSSRVSVIPNGVDTRIFRLQDPVLLRRVWGLGERKIVLFVASEGIADPNKGFDLLDQAVGAIPIQERPLIVTVGGQGVVDFESRSLTPRGNERVALGNITDGALLAQIYNLADALAIPSLQENLPFVALEAICCGIPVVAFRVGGLPEIVSEPELGVLVSPYSVPELSAAITALVVEGPARAREMRAALGAARYGCDVFVRRYADKMATLAAPRT